VAVCPQSLSEDEQWRLAVFGKLHGRKRIHQMVLECGLEGKIASPILQAFERSKGCRGPSAKIGMRISR
jgi:hypothetical protein